MTEMPEAATGHPAGERSPLPESLLHAEVGAAVDAWFVAHIHNSPLAQATAAYNHLVDKIGVLKLSLVAALKQEI